jgi:hypothetical protein
MLPAASTTPSIERFEPLESKLTAIMGRLGILHLSSGGVRMHPGFLCAAAKFFSDQQLRFATMIYSNSGFQ